MGFFKLPKFNKKLFKNAYFCSLLFTVAGYLVYIFYNNIDRFTNTNFLDKSKKQLILFYSPDCGYCKKILPIWNEFELNYQGKKNVQITKINGYSYPDLTKQYKISGFPTILYLNNGTILEHYEGDRTINSFVEFFNKIK